ncbi:MAG: hypothetical protein ACM3MG_00020 [Bacillota bacterium]
MISNRLSYEILDLKDSNNYSLEKFQGAYSFWKSQWREFFIENKMDEHLVSDEFTRADSAGVLFYEDKIASIILFKERDLTLQCWRDDSYFKIWPETLLTKLAHDKITKVMSAGYLTVHPLLRGDQFRPSLKNIMVALVGCHLTHTSAQAAICVTNNLKGVNSSTERCGWNLAAAGLELFQHPVNLYVLSQDNARAALLENSNVNQMVHSLYPTLNQKKLKMA